MQLAERRIKYSFASECETIETIWMERFGIAICVLAIDLTNAMIRQPKANMIFSFVKGIRLDMTKFLTNFD